jgi:glycosyltransferase involved in cell wall biosynthesis
MKNYDLSVIIPSRNERFLVNTVENILKQRRGKTEIIVGLDEGWPDPPVKDHEDVTLVHTGQIYGQRGMSNQCAKLSRAKYIMKCDAHCGFDEGFDVKIMEDMKDNWTMVPVMRNLHAFDWVCKKCNRRWYQGPTPTKCLEPGCNNTTDFFRDFKWIGKTNPQSDSYCFNSEPQFQYFREYRSRPEYKEALEKTKLTNSMSLQGSFFLLTREKYWELNICDEGFGSWGSQGIEVAVKTWLSGGRVVVSHKTWYGHMFRTQGGDFGFPYPQSARKVKENRAFAKDYFFNNTWPKAVHPLSWLLEKFWPVPGWTQEELDNLKKQEAKK